MRVLVDDFFHRWEGGDLSRLGAHPNVTLRLFNPHSNALPAPMGFLAEFPRVNRRMHSKMLLVDDRVAIVGGGNIADEYLLKDPDSYFTDFDIRIEGSDIRRFNAVFEAFRQDDLSVSYAGLRKNGKDERLRLSTRSEPLAAVLPQKMADHRNLPSLNARGTLHADSPDRVRNGRSDQAGEVEGTFLAVLSAARSGGLVVIPDLIPEAHGVRVLEALTAPGRRGHDPDELVRVDQPPLGPCRVYALSQAASRRRGYASSSFAVVLRVNMKIAALHTTPRWSCTRSFP